MTDEPDNLMLRMLRRISGDIAEMKVTLQELKVSQGALLQIAATQESRLLRIEGEIVQINKRLELERAE
jgi:DNA-binding FrmR family transcriptional regulator